MEHKLLKYFSQVYLAVKPKVGAPLNFCWMVGLNMTWFSVYPALKPTARVVTRFTDLTVHFRSPDAAGRYRDEECFSHFFSRISSMLWDGL